MPARARAAMPSGPSATSSTLRGIGSEVNTTSQSAATCATEVPAVAPRSVQALIAAGLRSNTTTSWLVLRMMLRHMGPPILPTPMKPTFIAVFPLADLAAPSMAYRRTARKRPPVPCGNRRGGGRWHIVAGGTNHGTDPCATGPYGHLRPGPRQDGALLPRGTWPDGHGPGDRK